MQAHRWYWSELNRFNRNRFGLKGASGAAQGNAVVIPQAPDLLLQPVVAAQAAYPFFAALARARGMDPDSPPHLQKVTRTL